MVRREPPSKRAAENVVKGLALTSLYVFSSRIIISGK